jgi:hypothetical protein
MHPGRQETGAEAERHYNLAKLNSSNLENLVSTKKQQMKTSSSVGF